MADEPNGAAGGAGAGTQVTPANPPVNPAPQGRTISNEQWETFQRYEQQAKGAQPFYEKAKAAGFTKPEDFDKWTPVLKTITDKKIDPGAFSRMFESDPVVKKDGPEFNADEFRRELEGGFEKKLAQREHEAAVKSESVLIDKAVKDFLGDEDADGWTKASLTRAFKAELEDLRDMYPKGHPLHTETLAPLTEAHVAKAVKAMKDERAKYAGEKMNDRATKAAGTVKTTPSGAGSLGKAKDTKPRSKDELLDELITRKKG